jgi:hypothetical protein
MREYYVVSIRPFSQKVKIIKAESYEKAISISKEETQKKKQDCLIVSKGDENNDYIVEKHGYYKVYDFLNKLLLFFAFMLILFISYLYFRFKTK